MSDLIANLPTLWFILLGVLLGGYAVLDGYDLGVGLWHLTLRREEDRRLLLQAIGPVWDGNEVWLVMGGGALFAAFPAAYAAVFSGFYGALVLLLMGIVFRAIALEFRSLRPSPRWRMLWDGTFSFASCVIPLLLGCALGNILWGVPLSESQDFLGRFAFLLRPGPLYLGVVVVLLFMGHGAVFAVTRTAGGLQALMRRRARILLPLAGGLAAVALGILLLKRGPALNVPGVAVALGLAAAASGTAAWVWVRRRPVWAFFFSSASVLGWWGSAAACLYPNLLVSSPLPERSVTIFNAASSPKTLAIMLAIAVFALPLGLAYTVFVHWVFRGPARLDPHGY